MDKYNPQSIEKKWQDFWEKNPTINQAKDGSALPKQFILDMFPYPSGAGLHAGHVESYTATDILSRYYRMQGFNVLHPQGWDAFGLPAENYAVKTGIHPDIITHKNIKNFICQIKSLGMSYDWSREIDTSNPEYYKWTQWFFLFLYKNGLAYKKKAKVNWCENCQTVLANEQAEGGICERCKNKVVQKYLAQWFFRITDFVENREVKIVNKEENYSISKKQKKDVTSGLLEGLKKLDWPNSIKSAQKNWIGRSEGSIVKFKIIVELSEVDSDFIEVFTTRVDTIFGCTYCVIAPEHKIVQELKNKIKNKKEVLKYIQQAKNKTELDRMEAKDKTGVELKGIKAVNPFNSEEIPVYVADYVLAQYGTGVVMAVPAHDERDWEFAQKYKLPIKQSISPLLKNKKIKKEKSELYVGYGKVINSKEYSGLSSVEAQEKMIQWLEKNKLGKRKINYKLRDWLVSRQRYWGAPIPIIYCNKCGTVPVPEKDLPVKLPRDVDFQPTGESPLAQSKSFQQVICPRCGAPAKRESDTMDTFVCSSWYYFRYTDPHNKKEFASKEKIKQWLPVDLYVGGAEHAVLHLLYARFFTKVLHNLGYIDFDEPFLRLRNQGMIMAEDGRKMSKSLGNVVNPDEVVDKFGADSLRLFEMFMGPLEDTKPWQTNGIVGMYRFLEKVYKLKNKKKTKAKNLTILVNQTIKKITEDIKIMHFNTAISSLMILVNRMDKEKEVFLENYETLIKLIAPLAPHIAEELWHQLGRTKSVFQENWPQYDKNLLKDEEIEFVIQINGKVREKIRIMRDTTKEEIKEKISKNQKIKKYLKNQKIKKFIFIKNKLANVVI